MESRSPTARLIVYLMFGFAALAQMEAGVFYAHHLEMPWSSNHTQTFVYAILMTFWLDYDSRERKSWRVWDLGYFAFAAWPLVIPYYLIKTRGMKRASLLFLLAGATYVGSFLAPALVCFAMRRG